MIIKHMKHQVHLIMKAQPVKPDGVILAKTVVLELVPTSALVTNVCLEIYSLAKKYV